MYVVFVANNGKALNLGITTKHWLMRCRREARNDGTIPGTRGLPLGLDERNRWKPLDVSRKPRSRVDTTFTRSGHELVGGGDGAQESPKPAN